MKLTSPFPYLAIAIIISCSPSSSHSGESGRTLPSDTAHEQNIKADTNVVKPDTNSCQLELYSATSPLPVYTVTQVISFDPKNPDCWKALEEHGHLFCKDRFPCRILFIDSDKLGAEKSDRTMPNFEELKKVGIGEYTKLANGWQLCGARSCGWERDGTAYGYFNDYP